MKRFFPRRANQLGNADIIDSKLPKIFLINNEIANLRMLPQIENIAKQLYNGRQRGQFAKAHVQTWAFFPQKNINNSETK